MVMDRSEKNKIADETLLPKSITVELDCECQRDGHYQMKGQQDPLRPIEYNTVVAE
jgi:hypothetical protein